VLLASDGLTAEVIAAAVGKSLLTVRRWRRCYVAKEVDGLLKDATRPSRVKPLSPTAGGICSSLPQSRKIIVSFAGYVQPFFVAACSDPEFPWRPLIAALTLAVLMSKAVSVK
jgi:Homeodomain-like domain